MKRQQRDLPCVSVFEGRRLGESAPHYAPEKNPFVDELTKLFHMSCEPR